MGAQPGSIYKVGGRRYVDSQAVYNLAGGIDAWSREVDPGVSRY